MQHIIATRFGIGISRKTFFQHHLEVLRKSLYPSLKIQTEKNFTWVVMCDVYIDPDSLAELRILTSNIGGRVLIYDPIKNGRMLPDVNEIFEEMTDDKILMSRVDDDDVFSANFVERLQTEAEKCSSYPTSIALSDGIDLFPNLNSYRKRHHPTTPVGISMLSTASSPISVYSGSHTLLHKRTVDRGGTEQIIRTHDPMWIYVRRPSSDSSEHRGDMPNYRLHVITEPLINYFIQCGLPEFWIEELVELQASEFDPRPPVVGEIKLNRLEIKANLLKTMNSMRKNGKEDTDQFHALVSSFYAF